MTTETFGQAWPMTAKVARSLRDSTRSYTESPGHEPSNDERRAGIGFPPTGRICVWSSRKCVGLPTTVSCVLAIIAADT